MQQPILFVLILNLILFTSCQKTTKKVTKENWQTTQQEVLQKAANYLWSQQAEDGGWHSQTHGIMKGGQAFTPFILDALSVEENADRNFSGGLSFIINSLDSLGVAGRTSSVMEYPVYATAYAYRAIIKNPFKIDTTFAPVMEKYLLSQQFIEHRGINLGHPAYGAWGFGETNLAHGQAGHVDLSHTRRVLETLQMMGLPKNHEAFQKAKTFLARLQKENQSSFNGGFCASTHTLGTNKADDQKNDCHSYATATADGVLALLAVGFEVNSEPVLAAKKWLLANEDWTYVSGIPKNMDGNWGEVLFFYHIAVRAQAYQKLGIANDWQIPLLELLKDEQQTDGSFTNPAGAPNKENDPLLATALVIRALQAMK